MRALVSRLTGTDARQSLIAITDQTVVSGTRFAATILIGRIAGMEELGLYAIGFSIIILISTIQEALLMSPYSVLGAREGAAGRRRFADSIFTLSCGLGVVHMCAALFGAFLAPALGYADQFYFLIAIAITVPFVLLHNFARKMCYAHFRLRDALFLDTGVTVIQITGLVGLAMTASLSAATSIAAMGVASAVPGLVWSFSNRRSFVTQWKQAWLQLRQNWTFGKWILGTQQIRTLGGSMILWFISALSGVAAAGVFAACSIVITAANPLLLGLGNLLEPRTARALVEQRRAAMLRVIHRTTTVLGGVLGVYCVIVLLGGENALAWLFDDGQFLGQAHMLMVMAFIVLLRGLMLAPSLGLRALGRTKYNFAASLLNLLVSLTLAYPLIVQFGALGGAYAIFGGVIAGSAARLWFFARAMKDG